MEITKHSSCNTELQVSIDQRARGVVPLPIYRGPNEIGQTVVMSFWKPSVEELEALNKGHLIGLEVWGNTAPPVRISVLAEKE